jgi:DNA-directed RNA polymerase subunit RPC12/RpoP
MSKIIKYRCPSCEKIYELDQEEDARALYPQIMCDACDTLCDRFVNPQEPIGDIDDIEDSGRQEIKI